ncbi:MAG: DUF1963 domain-containing protein [Planctomycetes bacterium]|nr:DUF1963 domain-containing protein [Planctomycetota bacterium]
MQYINSLRKPSIGIKKANTATYSKIGGLPNLPDGLEWPTWKDKPQNFLCQIDLSEIPDELKQHSLPKKGILYFFNNQEQDTWGFDPKDKGSWAVLYSQDSGKDAPLSQRPDSLLDDFVYKEKHIQFESIKTYPSWEDGKINTIELNDKQFDEYNDLCQGVYNYLPTHQMFGFPSPVQGSDMDLECQLASNGIYCGDGKGYESKEAKILEARRRDWILLLQIDTDDESEMMWGDCGMLYFWIRKQDIKSMEFNNCWMILQCS